MVNGSPTKTQMVDSAGGRSQLATLTTSVIVLIVLLFLTKPLAYMPEAVLSSVVFLIGVELVDAKGMRKIFAERPAEFWVALITALVVIFIGVEQGILLAIVLSILIHTRHGYKPKNALLSIDNVREAAYGSGEQPCPDHPRSDDLPFPPQHVLCQRRALLAGGARAGEHAPNRRYPGSASMQPRWMISTFPLPPHCERSTSY